MPFLIALLVIALIVAFLFLSTLFIVPQQQAYIIERFGKFNKVQFAGIHIRIPFVDRIAMKTNMRVNQLNVQLETKTLDNVFVTVVASTQFRVDPEQCGDRILRAARPGRSAAFLHGGCASLRHSCIIFGRCILPQGRCGF